MVISGQFNWDNIKTVSAVFRTQPLEQHTGTVKAYTSTATFALKIDSCFPKLPLEPSQTGFQYTTLCEPGKKRRCPLKITEEECVHTHENDLDFSVVYSGKHPINYEAIIK